jgi:hypothetical protein
VVFVAVAIDSITGGTPKIQILNWGS